METQKELKTPHTSVWVTTTSIYMEGATSTEACILTAPNLAHVVIENVHILNMKCQMTHIATTWGRDW